MMKETNMDSATVVSVVDLCTVPGLYEIGTTCNMLLYLS